ncbi:MAG: EamA family transporter [Propionicimonas sp.]
MTVLAALFASLAWGVADFLGGAQSRRLAAVSVAAGSQVVGLLLLGTLAIITRPTIPQAATLLAGVAAGVSSFVGLTLMYRALATGTMGVVAPIVGSSAVVPLLWGVVQGDRLTAWQTAGTGACLIGILIVTRGSREPEKAAIAGAPQSHARANLRPIALAAASAIIFGASLAFLAEGADEAPLVTTVVMRIAAATVAVVVVAASRQLRPVDRRSIVPILAIGTLDAGAYLAFGWASSTAQLAIVSVLSALYPVVTAVLAFLFHAERLTRVQLGGVALTLAGVAAIAL